MINHFFSRYRLLVTVRGYCYVTHPPGYTHQTRSQPPLRARNQGRRCYRTAAAVLNTLFPCYTCPQSRQCATVRVPPRYGWGGTLSACVWAALCNALSALHTTDQPTGTGQRHSYKRPPTWQTHHPTTTNPMAAFSAALNFEGLNNNNLKTQGINHIVQIRFILLTDNSHFNGRHITILTKPENVITDNLTNRSHTKPRFYLI